MLPERSMKPRSIATRWRPSGSAEASGAKTTTIRPANASELSGLMDASAYDAVAAAAVTAAPATGPAQAGHEGAGMVGSLVVSDSASGGGSGTPTETGHDAVSNSEMDAKMLAAAPVLPALVVAFALGSGLLWKRRLAVLGVGTAVAVASALLWFTAVDLTPANQRP